jgi:hypothetical protein
MQIQVIDNYISSDTAFYAANITLPAAGNVPLNSVSTPNWGRRITFTSGLTSNSGVTAVLTGQDVFGTIISETIALPAASSSISSTNYYSTLISVITDNAITDLSVGIAVVGQSVPFKMSTNVTYAQWAIQTQTTGLISYDIQYTLFPFEKYYTSPPTFSTPLWTSNAIVAPGGSGVVLTGKGSSLYFNFTAPVYAIRFVINSGTTITFQAAIAQQGTL